MSNPTEQHHETHHIHHVPKNLGYNRMEKAQSAMGYAEGAERILPGINFV